MHTPLWIKIGMGLGFAYLGLFAINVVGDMTGSGEAAVHGEEVAMHGDEHGDADATDAHDPYAEEGGDASEDGTDHTGDGTEPGTDDTPAVALVGNVEDGAKTAKKKCGTCHTFDEGGPNRVGPNLWGIVGRAKGNHEGFKFSSGMAGLGGTWSEEDLDHFLTDPKGYVSGTKMTFKGFNRPRDAQDKADVIAYMASLK